MFAIRAGILSYVLAIGLLVTVSLSMLSLYIYYSLNIDSRYQQGLDLTENLGYARTIALGAWEELTYNEPLQLDLFGQETDSITISKSRWGFLDVIAVRSYRNQQEKSSIFLIANEPLPQAKSALYLMDDGRPLSIAGDTKLIGDAYLPVSGIQTAFVGRIGYVNEELVYGNQLKSEPNLPVLGMEEMITKIESVSGQPIANGPDSISISFHEQTGIMRGGNLRLNAIYQGNLIIQASSTIVFDSLSQTEDIIALAPIIELKKGFKGTGQFIATDTLIVHAGASLQYPSLLAVYNETETALLKITSGSEVNGWVLMDGEEDGFRQRVLQIEDGAEVTGMIYCMGLLETYGTITGHVTAKRFLVNAPTAIYENYLFNTTIDATGLDSAFLIPPLWFYKPRAKVLKYVQ